MAIDATVKGISANAYVTQAETTTYLSESRLYTSAWVAATSADKDASIIWATALIDNVMDWFGSKRTIEQALRWPRSGLVDRDFDNIDDDTIPTLIKNATMELAFDLIKSDRTAQAATIGLGLSKAKIGPISMEVNKSDLQQFIPDYILAMLIPLGTMYPEAVRGDKMINLLRG